MDYGPMLGSFEKGVIIASKNVESITLTRGGSGAAQGDSFSVSLARV